MFKHRMVIHIAALLFAIAVFVFTINSPSLSAAENPQPFTPGFTGRLECHPVDEGKDEPELVAFRDACLKAAKNGDIKFLIANAVDDLPGTMRQMKGGGGIDPFCLGQSSLVDNLKDTQFRKITLRVLIDLIPMGGSWETDTVPGCEALHSCFQCDKWENIVEYREKYALDGVDLARILAEKVNVRSQPDSKSEVIAQVSNEYVDLLSPADDTDAIKETVGGETHHWCKIKTVDGKVGYVFSKYIHPKILFDYTEAVIFAKVDGKWRLAYFEYGC